MWLKEDNTDLKNIIGDNKLCMIGDLWLYCILAYELMMSTSLFVCLSTF